MAGYIELSLDQGASFNTSITIEEANGVGRNLVTSTIAAQMRRSYNALTSYPITTILSDGANGVLSLSMSAAQTANIKAGSYVYDVVTTNENGFSQRILEGIMIVTPGVTR